MESVNPMHQRTVKSARSVRKSRAIPDVLADAVLIDGRTAAATGGMSESQWRELVARGVAPAPAVRLPRFSRWRATDVRQFLERLARGEVAL